MDCVIASEGMGKQKQKESTQYESIEKQTKKPSLYVDKQTKCAKIYELPAPKISLCWLHTCVTYMYMYI